MTITHLIMLRLIPGAGGDGTPSTDFDGISMCGAITLRDRAGVVTDRYRAGVVTLRDRVGTVDEGCQ